MIEKHVHRLRRLKYKTGNAIFFCTLPDCSYKINTNLALGKRSICNRCGQEFLMDEYNLRLAKPHCLACHVSKDGNQGRFDITADDIKKAVVLDAVDSLPQQGLSLAQRLQQIVSKPSPAQTEEDDTEI